MVVCMWPKGSKQEKLNVEGNFQNQDLIIQG